MLEELRKAERYIFLEYFILQPGVFWNSILEILEEKAAQGVEVRLIYDDMGCMFSLPGTTTSRWLPEASSAGCLTASCL